MDWRSFVRFTHETPDKLVCASFLFAALSAVAEFWLEGFQRKLFQESN